MAFIVVVDDDEDVRELMKTSLRGGGHEIVAAADASEALVTIRDRRPDLIVTDFQMPGMTGLELAQLVRAEQATAEVPIILLTAVAKYKDFNSVDRWLDKPFSPASLRHHAEALLRRTMS
ncbi:response regulator [Actinoplanes sp. NPDC049681]|uniref:response regulator n=1 Tax=Actinoplanes sp. NPDC049681 TaxID=3363905 RepID=UPI0037B2BCD5